MQTKVNGMDPRSVALLLALGETIRTFTQRTPMTAELVIEALAFTAGSACGQREAHSKHSTRQLREMAVSSLDNGIDSAKGETNSRIILPN
jgi:hypothetical protein